MEGWAARWHRRTHVVLHTLDAAYPIFHAPYPTIPLILTTFRYADAPMDGPVLVDSIEITRTEVLTLTRTC